MRHDVDIHMVVPDEIHADPKLAAVARLGMPAPNARANYVAMFRDPAAARALAGAAPEVQAYFKASGFSTLASRSGLPPGTIDVRHQAHVLDVMKRLNENLPKHQVAGKDFNGIDMAELVQTLGQARPVRVVQGSTRRGRGRAGAFVSALMRRQGRRAVVGFAMLVVGLVASARLEGDGSGAMALFQGLGGEGARMVTVPTDAAD